MPGFFCDCSDTAVTYGMCVAEKPDGFLECIPTTPGDMGTDGPPPKGCMASSECTDSAMPICRAKICAACTPADDRAGCQAHNPLTPRCDGNGRCVACLPGATAPESADCGASMPICASGACRVCQSNSECNSGVCKADGTCASSTTEVVYVDNNPGKGCQPTGPGTQVSPFCEVQPAALAAIASAKPFVVVAGSANAYTTAINLTATAAPIGPLTILGPGHTATTTAKVQPSGVAPAVAVLTNGSTATVTIDGLELVGIGPTSPGVRCSFNVGAASVTLRNSLIRGAGGTGVETTGCTINVDASIISANSGGGLKLSSSTYTITNSIISGNGSGSATSAGVNLADSTGTFAFNTVARNTISAGVGGIDCGTGAQKAILNSIVWGNTTATGTQLGAKCTLTNVVTAAGDDTQGTMSAMAPSFVSATDFHLKRNEAANTACCIDKVTAPSTPNKDNDVDGVKHRPKGSAWDIGAHEVDP